MNEDVSLSQLGYRWPAEWEPHDATWLAWPHNQETWPTNLSAAQHEWTQLVRTIAEAEPVNVVVDPTSPSSSSVELQRIGNVTCVDLPTNDAWIRDYGPTFLINERQQSKAVIDWTYNAWGGKYPPYNHDQQLVLAWAGQTQTLCKSTDLIAEGGALEGNGNGVLLTTQSCLLDPHRNPNRTRSQIESTLKDMLGVDQVIWLPGEPIVGDDTDGHIDQIARFASVDRMIVSVEQNSGDDNFEPLRRNRVALDRWIETQSRRIDVVELPMPEPVLFDGQRLPASYANFCLTNHQVIVPLFECAADESAVRILGEAFPDRQVLGLPALNLLVGLGSFHCLSQQEPAIG